MKPPRLSLRARLIGAELRPHKLDNPLFRGTLVVDRLRGVAIAREHRSKDECLLPLYVVAAMIRDRTMRLRADDLRSKKGA